MADLQQLHNKARYRGTEDDFQRAFAKNLRYPASAMKAGTVGTVLGVIKISGDGEVAAIETLNKADKDLKAEFIRVARLTEKMWAATRDILAFSYAVIPIAFMMKGKGYEAGLSKSPGFFMGLARINGFSTSSSFAAPVKQEKDYVARANKLIEKGKYEKAAKELEQLVNLQPLYLPYYHNLVKLYEKMGDANQVAYYKQVLQLLES